MILILLKIVLIVFILGGIAGFLTKNAFED